MNKTQRKKCLEKFSDIFFCIIIRLILLAQIGFSTMFLAGFYKEYFYYGLLLGALVIVVDGFYVLFFKGAKEFRW